MAHGKSLQLRNITRPAPTMLHKSWEKIFNRKGELVGIRRFGPQPHNPDRATRRALVLAQRRAAKARRT